MSKQAFTIAYDGPALLEGAMDVRDLAPALLGLGQLMDAANANLNADKAPITLQVRATEAGSFQIVLELVQDWHQTPKFSGAEFSGAANLLALTLAGSGGLIWLLKLLKGKTPDKPERLPDNTIMVAIGTEGFIVALEVMRLYQDVAVRTAFQTVVEEPLRRDGVDSFTVIRDGKVSAEVLRADASSFAKPSISDEILVEETRRSAVSIISLAFKEDNKWRLYDGSTQINAVIEDRGFLDRLDGNQIAFSKGDILICDVRVAQVRTTDGLKTDYMVHHVVEHVPPYGSFHVPFIIADGVR